MMSTPAVRWRESTPSDDLFLEELYIAVHRLEFAACALSEEQLHSLLHMQARAQRLGYRRDFPHAVDRVILPPDRLYSKPIGRLLVAYDADAVKLVDIALIPGAQRQGIGTALLHNLMADAQAAGLPLRLSVRPDKPALRLYERLGFRIVAVGVQVEMEHSPGEDPHLHPAVRPPLGPSPQAAEPADTALSRVMERLNGRRFSVHLDPLPDRPEPFLLLPELVLTSVQRFGASAGDSFALIFEGPLTPVLPQAIYQLRVLPTLEAGIAGSETEYAIFLVPIGSQDGDKAGAMQYEAIFNR